MIKINTDAAYQVRDQSAGLGIVIKQGAETQEYKYHLNTVDDNHQAEFLAVYLALQLIKLDQNEGPSIVIIHTDSQVVADSINKAFVKKAEYQPLLQGILRQTASLDTVIVEWVPEGNNRLADHLARQALRKQGILNGILPSASLADLA